MFTVQDLKDRIRGMDGRNQLAPMLRRDEDTGLKIDEVTFNFNGNDETIVDITLSIKLTRQPDGSMQ